MAKTATRGRQRGGSPEHLVFTFNFLSITAEEADEFRSRIRAYQDKLLSGEQSAVGVLTKAIEERAPAILWQTKAYLAERFARDVIDARLTDAERERFRNMVDAFCAQLEEGAAPFSLQLKGDFDGLTVKQQSAINYAFGEYKSSVIFAMREAALRAVTPMMLDEILRSRSKRGG